MDRHERCPRCGKPKSESMHQSRVYPDKEVCQDCMIAEVELAELAVKEGESPLLYWEEDKSKWFEDDERYFIVDAVAHRRAERSFRDANPLPQEMKMVVIDTLAFAQDTDWVCDFCNDPIKIEEQGMPFPVPCILSNAICAKCAERHLEGKGFGEKFPVDWSDQACGCGGCKRTYEMIMAMIDG